MFFLSAISRQLATLLLAGALSLPLNAAASPSSEPIKIALHDWTSQEISSRLMGRILEQAGHKVEYVDADYLGVLKDMEIGSVDLAMEIWATTATEALQAATAGGKVENLGPTGMTAIEHWWYPSYMLEQCPGLPDWRALLQADCAAAFATPESAPKGFYLGGPADWGGFDPDRIAALKLPFAMKHAESTAALLSALEQAYAARQPIMLWLYSPHWAPRLYAGDWVAFPAWEQACYDDPAWGINPEMAFDCGKPTGPIWKAAASDLKQKWPRAHQAIRSYRMSNDEMEAMLVAIQRDGKSVEQVVADWLAANEATWRRWID